MKTQNVQKTTPVNFNVVRKKVALKIDCGGKEAYLNEKSIFDRPTDNEYGDGKIVLNLNN